MSNPMHPPEGGTPFPHGRRSGPTKEGTAARFTWRKYPAIGAICMRARTAYRFDVLVGATLPFLRVLLAFLLWGALFAGRDEIGGYTLLSMTFYYILTAFLARLDQSGGLVWEYAGDIKEGRFAKYLTKPVNPFGHFLATAAANTLYVAGIALVSCVVLLAVFSGVLHDRPAAGLPGPTPASLLAAVLLSLLGLVFSASLNWLTAILAWKFQDISGFHMIKGVVVEFLTGAMLPLSLLPSGLQAVMRLFPFYSMQYLPASLFLGLKTEEAPSGLLILALWTIGFLLLGEFAWRRLRRLDEGVGA